MSNNAVIVDYGSGNLSSVKRAFALAGTECRISSDREEILNSSRLVLSGVGHFQTAMSRLAELGLIDVLSEAVIKDRKPILGICLGMELFAKTSEEGNAKGLGWIDGDIVRFAVSDQLRYKVPHIGWNRMIKKKESRLMRDIPDFAEFYFIHSYYLNLADRSALLNESEYETPFPSAIEKENIFGVQYHPEKSRQFGLQLLKNFAEI